jgi:hypothetical protein
MDESEGAGTCSRKQYDHLAAIRSKAVEARRRYAEERKAKLAEELRQKILREANEAPLSEKAEGRQKAVAVAVPEESSSDSSDSESDSSRSPSPPPVSRRATKSDSVARKLQRMEKELWKLKVKERYAKRAAALHAPPPTPHASPHYGPQPIVVQVPEARERKGAQEQARSLESTAELAKALMSASAGASERSSRTMPFPGGFSKLF